jgi:AcrR family transcriptional regulator
MAGDVTTVKTRNRTKPPTRRDRADATRLRIVKAAYELFCERGYAGTMLSDVAAAAGVAVQTVRFNFHTKGELLSRADGRRRRLRGRGQSPAVVERVLVR